jgi:hypothetical protein
MCRHEWKSEFGMDVDEGGGRRQGWVQDALFLGVFVHLAVIYCTGAGVRRPFRWITV